MIRWFVIRLDQYSHVIYVNFETAFQRLDHVFLLSQLLELSMRDAFWNGFKFIIKTKEIQANTDTKPTIKCKIHVNWVLLRSLC